jgi:hypothetical protein
MREIQPPARAAPVAPGLIIAILLFTLLLMMYETQPLADLGGHPAWLGKPLFAGFYNPLSVGWWMQRFDPAFSPHLPTASLSDRGMTRALRRARSAAL